MGSQDPPIDPALLPAADATGVLRFTGVTELTGPEEAATATLQAALGYGYASVRPRLGEHWSCTLELTWPEGPTAPALPVDHDRVRAFLAAHQFEKTGRVLLGGTFGDLRVTEYLGRIGDLCAVLLLPAPEDLDAEGVLHLAYFRPPAP